MPADTEPEYAQTRSRTVNRSKLIVSEAAAACQPRRLLTPIGSTTDEEADMQSNDPPQADWLRDLGMWRQGLRLLGFNDDDLTGRRSVDRIAARFRAKVGRRHNCLIWLGTGAVYGRANIAGQIIGAHRIALAVGAGIDIDGFVVRHDCDNPPCVTPNHLQRGTQADNVADALSRGRWSCGERSPKAKLTEAQVLEIRAARAAGETCRALAAQYQVTVATISRIDTGRLWRHVA
jgi:hypothetical protein